MMIFLKSHLQGKNLYFSKGSYILAPKTKNFLMVLHPGTKNSYFSTGSYMLVPKTYIFQWFLHPGTKTKLPMCENH